MARRSDEDDAPWLAEAMPAQRTTVTKRSLFWTLFIMLSLATVAAVGLILLMAKKDGGSTEGYMNAEQAPVITAEPGPYKVKPADPAGMAIEGIDGTMYTTGEGIDSGSTIDPSLAPEVPMPRPGTVAGPPQDLVPEGVVEAPAAIAPTVAAPPAAQRDLPAPRPVPAPAPATTAAPKPPVAKPLVVVPKAVPNPSPVAKAGSVQLGAFSRAEKADAAWAGVAGKHGLTGKRVIAVERGGTTLYRLRASSADPAATCAKLKSVGDACAAVE